MQVGTSSSISDASTSEGSAKRKRSVIIVPEPGDVESDTSGEAAEREDVEEGSQERGSEKRRRVLRSETRKGEERGEV